MREIVEIDTRMIMPEPDVVLGGLGYPSGSKPEAGVETQVGSALSLLEGLLEERASSRGVLADITGDEFGEVYCGAGANEPETPLEEIFPRADGLALFAVTLGEAVSRRIAELFEANEYVLAAALDAAASEATERAGEALERRYFAWLETRGERRAATVLLRYSPGYCGWHVSGQKALFDALDPGRIGISLRESFLMEPLKSISGVIVAGPAEIHDFEAGYPFCSLCETRRCRERNRGRGEEPT